MLIVTCCGVILNIISIFYFAHLKHQRTFYRLMLLLAVIDTIFLITSALSFTFPHLNDNYADYTWMYLVPYTLPIAQTCLTASVYMTVSLTLERFFSVVHPLYQLKKRWLRSSVVLSLPGLVFSVLFTLPNYFQLRTIIKTDVITKLDNKTHSQLIELLRDVYPFGRLNSSEKPNSYQFQEIEEDSYLSITQLNETNFLVPVGKETVHHVKMDNNSLYLVEDPYPDIDFAEFRNNKVYIKVYVMWLHVIFNLILPFVLLVYLNTAIYRKLNKFPIDRFTCNRSENHEQTEDVNGVNNNFPLRRNIDSKLRKRERRLARISLLIVIIFIICHSVKNIPTVFELFGKDPRNVPVCSQILLIGHLLLSINSSVNFLVYSAGNSKKIFRFLYGIVSKTVYNTSWMSYAYSEPSNNSTEIMSWSTSSWNTSRASRSSLDGWGRQRNRSGGSQLNRNRSLNMNDENQTCLLNSQI